MNLGIKGKKALVTGAGRGLGESITRELAKEGVKVAIVSRTEKDLENLMTEIGGRKAGHFSIVSDLTQDGAPGIAINLIRKEFGNPDIVVNNLGGTLNLRDPYCPISDWRKLWRLNIEVTVEINNLLIPFMVKKQWGRIINMSSIAGLENQGPVPFCTLKAGLIAYSRSMGRILAKDGIIMTSVLPGAVFTKKGDWDKMLKTNPSHVKKYLEERMAIGRFGKPEEVSNLVVFLCSVHASFCVGSAIPVDGGQGRCFF
jgi:NAD(P)-dependent dehydrogenase (short-subunit alcohol dehydrogenase family)